MKIYFCAFLFLRAETNLSGKKVIHFKFIRASYLCLYFLSFHYIKLIVCQQLSELKTFH